MATPPTEAELYQGGIFLLMDDITPESCKDAVELI